MTDAAAKNTLSETMRSLGRRSRRAAQSIARTTDSRRSDALRAAARALIDNRHAILAANARDCALAESAGATAARLDRLSLDEKRIESMAQGLVDISGLDDPLGRELASWRRPNGLEIRRVSVPIGVIGIIYESRPNVTADASALCIKSGNAVILRGGSESFWSCSAIHESMQAGIRAAGIDEAAVQMVPTTDRDAVGYLLSEMRDFVDVVVPRGGRSLVERVARDARVPVIGHLDGICHVYVHGAAEADMAVNVVVNAKMRRPGICGAAETLLVDRDAAGMLSALVRALIDSGCEVRGDEATREVDPGVLPATDSDWSTEYLDAVISVRVVDDIDAAIDHIGHYGSGHTDCIVTEDADAAERFSTAVDSAIVMHNASTQFADGGEFGFGGEIGIATGRIHARGPVGAEQLTSYKYIVSGNGQTRP